MRFEKRTKHREPTFGDGKNCFDYVRKGFLLKGGFGGSVLSAVLHCLVGDNHEIVRFFEAVAEFGDRPIPLLRTLPGFLHKIAHKFFQARTAQGV
ncbi:hypothetical protein FV230_01185 [Methylobacterium sp. WL6]|nr:hypothetical protein FV230_01185 [Methylobacterium sp. WL6]